MTQMSALRVRARRDQESEARIVIYEFQAILGGTMRLSKIKQTEQEGLQEKLTNSR